MAMKIIIVGGVAGGASAAARLRRLDEKAEIVVFEKGRHVSYANCGLPYYAGGVIENRDALLIMTPEKLKALLNLDIRTRSEVTAIDRRARTVTVRELPDGREYTERYDKLVLAPGAKPFLPPVPGMNLKKVFTLRTLDDADRLKETVVRSGGKTAAVIGAGFIGVETAESLTHAGVKTALIEKLPQILPPLDPEMACGLQTQLRDKGVSLYLGAGLAEIRETETGLALRLDNGVELAADFAVCALGVRPETELAKQAGLEIGAAGGIKTDRQMRTSDPDIYAVGDAVETPLAPLGATGIIPLAGPANRQGRIAAENIMGAGSVCPATLGTAILKVFNLTAAMAGHNEKHLAHNGIPYLKSYAHGLSHSGYYPGAFPLVIKLLFSPDGGKLLGAQAVGMEGADKRLDVIAAVMQAGGTIYDLLDAQMCYAPPYGSAKDPVNIAAMTAENILAGLVNPVYPTDLDRLAADKNFFLLDVRTPEEYLTGSLPGATNIALSVLRGRLPELPRGKTIVTLCSRGKMSYFAARLLMQEGFRTLNLNGGYSLYKQIKSEQEAQAAGSQPRQNPAPDATSSPAGCPKNAARIEINACGLQCPGPIMKLSAALNNAAAGSELLVSASDPGFKMDVAAWCSSTGNTLINVTEENRVIRACIKKGTGEIPASTDALNQPAPAAGSKNRTIVVFSGDLDRALAAFIIANGAAALGGKVTMFFTFWGLNILRRETAGPAAKGFLDRLFGLLMPRGANRLALSNMHFLGLGTALMKHVMKTKNVTPLPELIKQAQRQGVKIVACTMAMDIMGIRREELIAGVETAGVASYLADAQYASTNLFI
ncbi:MAG: FAD-dependent oxidoreductase [Elusimicrobiaceae bacterium]|nr:FAD-dependent oxidoreductase [Elusimicrobiaceae bacterium]